MACNFSVCNGQGKKALFLSASNGVESFCARQKALHPMAASNGVDFAVCNAQGKRRCFGWRAIFCVLFEQSDAKTLAKLVLDAAAKGMDAWLGALINSKANCRERMCCIMLLQNAAALGGRLVQQHRCIFWLLLALQRPNPGSDSTGKWCCSCRPLVAECPLS